MNPDEARNRGAAALREVDPLEIHTLTELREIVDRHVHYPGEQILERRFPQFDRFADTALVVVLLVEDAVHDAGAGDLKRAIAVKMLRRRAQELMEGIRPEWFRQQLLGLMFDWIPAALQVYAGRLNDLVPGGEWRGVLDRILAAEGGLQT